MAGNSGPKIVSNGLIYKLDAANNKSFPKSGTEFKDLTRKKAASTLINGPVFNTGKNGHIVLDGVNDYIDCGVIKPTGAMTISTWHKNDVYINTHVAGRGNVAGYEFGVQTSVPNKWSYWARVAVASTQWVSVTTNPWIADTTGWVNSVFVYIPSTSITTYQNGIQVGQNTTSIPASQYVGNPSNTRINASGHPFYYAGSIAEVSIYDIALTQNQILKNYRATKSRFK